MIVDLMSTVADNTPQRRTKKRSLIRGRNMVCPRCVQEHDILAYIPFEQKKAFADETNPVYKCPACRWVFSPAPHVIEVFRD